jgi:hypothetical protein
MPYFWKYPLRIADQKTSLPTSAIAHNNELLAILWRCRNVGPGARRSSGIDCAVRASVRSSITLAAIEKRSRAVLAPEVIVALYRVNGHGVFFTLCFWNDICVGVWNVR